MNVVSERLWVLLHEPEGPLVPYLDSFAKFLLEQGFKQHLIDRRIRIVAYFSKWLKTEEVLVRDVTDAHVPRFLKVYEQSRSVQRGEFATLRRLIDFLRQLDVIGPKAVSDQSTPIQQVVSEFCLYLRQERALSDKTVIQYCPFVERFLSERFGRGPLNLAAIRADHIVGFVKQLAEKLSPPRAKSATTALRSFFGYLRYCGATELDLASAVPTVPNWSMTAIPRAIDPDHVCAVFAHCPRDTPIGRRDYAILMLLARLGLRSSEIVSLTLDDIDWEAGFITITGKGDREGSLPMPIEVGEAIVDYLRQGRPNTTSRSLFLRAYAPIRGLGSQTSVGTIVGAAIKRAGIETRYRGAHQFRHALATDMLRHGATLPEIGSVLRHRNIKTTSVYAKVDLAALRPLSLSWPEAEA